MHRLFFDPIRDALERMRQGHLLRRFGGIQRCPWCKQIAQSGEGWHFKTYAENPGFDVLTCGICGGTSLWHFALGMHYVGFLAPPLPLLSSALTNLKDHPIFQQGYMAGRHDARLEADSEDL